MTSAKINTFLYVSTALIAKFLNRKVRKLGVKRHWLGSHPEAERPLQRSGSGLASVSGRAPNISA
jgi:hypothetical protein